jgi:hypothetical protein
MTVSLAEIAVDPGKAPPTATSLGAPESISRGGFEPGRQIGGDAKGRGLR